MKALSNYTNNSITTRPIFYCNDMAAVTRTNKFIDPGITTHIAAEFDMAREIWSVKEEGFDVTTMCVKAHQDDKLSVHLLPLDA
eukprot:1173276-Ditylum_brightwellii.AAC.1